MKPCPFCAEPIQDDAIKCRFCGSLLVPEELSAGGSLETGEIGQPSTVSASTRPFPLLWMGVAAGCLVAALVGVVLLIRAASPPAETRTPIVPPPAPVTHRFLDIAWGTPVNEVAAQLASRGFQFTEQDEEGDHVFQGDIEGRPAVVVAMLARGALAKTIVIMVGEGDAAALYAETNRRLTKEYGPPSSSTSSGDHPVSRWSSGERDGGTRLWTTITDRGDVAIHYESELWPAESRRRRIGPSTMDRPGTEGPAA